MTPKARLQALLRNTRGQRHWRGAALLRKAGIPTAWTWALLRGRHNGQSVECLVMEALHGKTVLQHLADNDLSVRSQHALATALGRHAAEMTRNALCNRDSKPSNLIVQRDAAGVPTIAVIDCVAIGRPGCADRVLASFAIEPLGVGLPPRRALMMRVIRAWLNAHPTERNRGRRSRRFLWERVSGQVKAHGDPTPKVNPLSSS